MDPELKALLRGFKPGSREYTTTVNRYMSDKAAREGASADRAAQRQEAAAAAEAQRAAADQAAQEARDQRTSMITGGSAVAGLGAGFAGGKYADTVANLRADAVLNSRAAEVTNAAQAARAVNPNSAAATGQYADIAKGLERSGAMRPRVMPIGTGLTGAGLLGLGAYSNFDRAPNAKSDQERALWTGAGYGEMGAGVKMLADSARRYVNPGVTLPAADLAAVEGAARMGAGGKVGPVTPAADADPYRAPASKAADTSADPAIEQRAARLAELRKSRVADLKAQAKALKLPTSGVKEDLAARIANAEGSLSKSLGVVAKAKGGGKSGLLLPLAAGGMAYDAASGEAEAAGATPMEARGRGALAGAAAGGATAAIPYAISKLPASVGQAAQGAGPGMAPGMIDAMTDYSPDDLAMGRNMLARNLPSFLRGGAVEDAYQMAQVPQRGVTRDMIARALADQQQ